MRKWLVNLTGILTISSSALPLVGCTFNFYVDSVKKKIAVNLANQTSSIIKSLIAAKNLNSDTQATINDALSIAGQPIIQNYTNTINNWTDFNNNWGYQGQINTQGFDKNNLIIANGAGNTTKQVNSSRSTNQTLQYLSYINAISIIDNKTLYSVLIDKNAVGNPIIKQFLQTLKDNNLPSPWKELVFNLINNYQANFLDPIINVLNELIDGYKIPDQSDLKAYMEEWKDSDGVPYSQWITNNEWKLGESYYKDWKTNDIIFYYGGTFINYLFKKIGDDNKEQISNPQYLGDIISDNLDKDILQALQPYIKLLLTNPKYILILINGAIPLIKQLIFNASDLKQGINKLTFGNNYPTNKSNNSYNLKEVFLTLKQLLDPEKKEDLKIKIEQILISSFLDDIKIKYKILGITLTVPLGEALKLKLDFINKLKEPLINTIVDFLTGESFKSIFDSIYNVIEKLNDQFQGSDGIELDLTKLKDLLVGDNGLLIMLKDVVNIIRDIIKPNDPNDYDEITDEQLGELYTSLGGQLPINGSTPIDFKKDSIIWRLKNELLNKESELSKLAQIIIANDQYQSISNIISQQNETWIKEHYTDYLSPSYPKSQISNINFQTSEKNNQDIINISYDFYYEINSIKYHFFIKGITVDDKENFFGVHNFKFTDIYLL